MRRPIKEENVASEGKVADAHGRRGPLGRRRLGRLRAVPLPNSQSELFPRDAFVQTDRMMITVHAPGGACHPKVLSSP